MENNINDNEMDVIAWIVVIAIILLISAILIISYLYLQYKLEGPVNSLLHSIDNEFNNFMAWLKTEYME